MDEHPKVHYLIFTGPYHPYALPENVSTLGDIYIVSTPGKEACYARTREGWQQWVPFPRCYARLSHPHCHRRHLKYLWSDGIVVGWYSLDIINEARQNMIKRGIYDISDTTSSSQKVIQAFLANYNANITSKRPREQEEASQASETHPAKKSNTQKLSTFVLEPPPTTLHPISISPPPPKPEASTVGKSAASSDTEADARAEPSVWQAERETLLKQISDLNSELEKLRTKNAVPTKGSDHWSPPEKMSSNTTLSNQILSILAESMLDPKTLKTLGLGV